MEALYFTADWCHPCKVFGPEMEKVKDIVNLTKINIEHDTDNVAKYGIMSVPTVVFVKEGEEKARFVGARTEQWVRDFVKEVEV